MTKLFKIILSVAIPLLIVSGVVYADQAGTKIFGFQGGTGRDTTGWTGVAEWTNGVYGTTTAGGGGGEANAVWSTSTLPYAVFPTDIERSLGVGTTTPQELFTLYSTSSTDGRDLLRIASTTQDAFVIDKNGNVGIGTSTPELLLSINPSNNNENKILFYKGANIADSMVIGVTPSVFTFNSQRDFAFRDGGQNRLIYDGVADEWEFTMSDVGINTTGPDRKLDILDASNPQLRLTHTDGSVYVDMQASSTGDLLIDTSGTRVGFNITDFSSDIASGDLEFKVQMPNNTYFGVDDLNQQGFMELSNGTITGYVGHLNNNQGFVTGAASNHPWTLRTNNVGKMYIDETQGVYIAGDSNFETGALPSFTGGLIVASGNIGIATTTPNAKLTVVGDASITGQLTVDATTTIATKNINAYNAFYNGSFLESFNATTTSDGSTIQMGLANAEGSSANLTMRFSSGDTVLSLPTTISLVEGTDVVPVSTYVYIPESTKLITTSTVGFPTTAEHIKISYFFCPSATHVQTEGCYINQNWNDHAEDGNEQGHQSHMGEVIRYGTGYWSGIGANGTDQTPASSYFDYVSGTESYFNHTSGISYQMHRHTVPQFSSASSTDDIHVINWSGEAYAEISNLAMIRADSASTTLSNKYFNVFFFAVGNKTGEYAPMMAQLPSGSYNSQSGAENDTSGFDDTSIPREFKHESTTGIPVVRLTLRWTGGFTELTHISTKDCRESLCGGSGGGGSTGSLVNFSDDLFTWFDGTDVTKIVDVQLSGLTTGNTRTVTMQDSSGTMCLLEATQSFSGVNTYSATSTQATTTITQLNVGNYKLPRADGSNTFVLKTDGAGKVSWSADDTGSANPASRWTTSSDSTMVFPTDLAWNVGIATTTPQSPLTVVGNINGTGALTIDATSTFGSALTLLDDNKLWFDTAQTNYISYDTNFGSFRFNDNSNAGVFSSAEGFFIFAECGVDGAGDCVPEIDLTTDGGILMDATTGTTDEKIRIRAGASGFADLRTNNLAANHTFEFPSFGGTFLMATGTQDILTTGTATLATTTATGLTAENLTATNSTSTNGAFVTEIHSLGTLIIDGLTTLANMTAVNATTTNLTSVTSLQSQGTLTVAGATDLQSLTATNFIGVKRTSSINLGEWSATDTETAQKGAEVDLTITSIICYSRNTTATISMDIRATTSPHTAGTEIFTAEMPCEPYQSTATTTFNDATINGGALINIGIVGLTAQVASTTVIQINYTTND